MRSLTDVFHKIQETKREQRELRLAWKDALDAHPEYREIVETMTNLRNRKRQIEFGVKSQFKKEFDRLEDIKADLRSDAEMLSDIALTQLTEGKTVEIVDEQEQRWEPAFRVTFHKTT